MGAAASGADVVERRGEEPPLRGNVLEVDDAGVRVRTEAGASRWVSWDRVRRIEAASLLLHETAGEYEQLAEDLWRARTRVERHDTAIAEPLFEQYFDRYRGQTNETALVVAEGLLRCYLARDARVLAMVPAMEVARLRAKNVTTISYSTLPRVIDEATLLCPWLPPVWDGSPGLSSLAQALAAFELTEHDAVAGIASIYRQSVQQAMGESDRREGPRAGAVRHQGVELLRDLVASVDHLNGGHRAARARLERRLSGGDIAEMGAWAEAWTRFHLGRSMLNDRGETVQMRGLINLAQVPARFGASQPFLSGLSIAHLRAWHDARHDAETAASLLAELERRYPNHPARQDGFALRMASSSEAGDQ